jgi:hypothetical protein
MHRPELETIIFQRMISGGVQDIEDVLMQALIASPVAWQTSEELSMNEGEPQ